MADPAAHSARADAERSGQVVGSDVDRIESDLLGEVATTFDRGGFLQPGSRPPEWGVVDV